MFEGSQGFDHQGLKECDDCFQRSDVNGVRDVMGMTRALRILKAGRDGVHPELKRSDGS